MVGASLAGHAAVSALREHGYAGEVVVVGAEPHPPYDRPPLSKGYLAGKVTHEQLSLDADLDALSAQWLLGTPAAGLDVAGRRVRLADGTVIGGDLVVIATGARARTVTELLGVPAPAGVHHLRTADDATALGADLAGGGRLVVIGGGFIGCEVAATARLLGLDVTILEAGPLPLVGPLGVEVATAIAAMHERRGVRIRCGVGVTGLSGADRVESVQLADGSEVGCDHVVAALGSAPEVAWLADSGLEVDGGVRCDEAGVAAPGVLAVGDCAAWWDPALGRHLRVEHWTDAFDRARFAVSRFLDPEADQRPRPPAYFWSDQYDVRIQLAGRRTPESVATIEDGSTDGEDLLVVWRAAEQPTAVLGMNRARDVGRWRRRLVSSP